MKHFFQTQFLLEAKNGYFFKEFILANSLSLEGILRRVSSQQKIIEENGTICFSSHHSRKVFSASFQHPCESVWAGARKTAKTAPGRPRGWQQPMSVYRGAGAQDTAAAARRCAGARLLKVKLSVAPLVARLRGG